MADDQTVETTTPETAVTPEPSDAAGTAPAAKKTAAKKAPAKKSAAKSAAKKAPARKAAAKKAAAEPATGPATDTAVDAGPEAPEDAAPAKKAPAKRAAAKKTAAAKTTAAKAPAKRASKKAAAAPETGEADQAPAEASEASEASEAAASATAVLFQAPEKTTPRRRTRKAAAPKAAPKPAADEEAAELALALEPDESIPTSEGEEATEPTESTESTDSTDSTEGAAESAATEATDESDENDESDESDDTDDSEDGEGTPARRRRRRGGRRRRKPAGANADTTDAEADTADAGEADADAEGEEDSEDAEPAAAGTRRRRRRRRAGEAGAEGDDEPNTVVKVRESRPLEQQITAVSGSTRLEAKKQRRREGREAGRRRAPIVSEAEFLARRESVERVMVIRQRDDLTQIGVLEDKVLVEHYVARESQTSLIGNIYLGRVQNVLPSMEAAFIDIGKGRNAVLYAGEVNWSALGHKEGQPRKIESVLSSGQSVLVQVTKDPVGHKGARLTSQISLAGRFLVYVPDGTTSGISRKLPDTERNRLKNLLKEIVPESAGVIVRTAAEGASEEELTSDVERLKARWADIEAKSKGNAPQLLYGEPDLTLKVVRDLFTEDFSKLVVQGDAAWDTVHGYVEHVAPDLADRLEKHDGGPQGVDLFSVYRVDEQIAKGLDRKVWLPSGGSLIIDRTEAMTVVDVNTGKFTGSGGNLEETVTKNNLEAAEEIVRQLRLRDIGGIIVVDFIDMVLESNRDLVLRRLVECLGRDRTRHQVAEVTSLGLVQMTRKRIGTGLLEAFSETCTHCQGRGIIVHDHPIENGSSGVPPMEEGGRRNRRSRSRKPAETAEAPAAAVPSPKDIAMLPRHEPGEEVVPADEDLELDEALLDEEIAESVAEPLEDLEPIDDEPTEVAASEPADEPAEVPAEAPAEAATPKVVTRRRRGASRQVVSTGEATVMEAEIVAVDAPVVVPGTAQPPKVMTRTRGGASRAVVSTGE